MTKFTGVPNNNSPALADSTVGVTAGGTDNRFTLQNILTLFLANILSVFTNRRNNTTNITEAAAKVQSGWVAIAAVAGVNQSSTIVFPVAFTNVPIVLVTFGGDTAGATSTLGSGGANISSGNGMARAVTTSQFLLTVNASSVGWSVGNTVYAHWVAIGT